MKTVDRPTFVEHVNASPDWITIPVESSNMSVMQYTNKVGQLVAQAIYRQPLPGEKVIPEYQIAN